MHFNWIRLHIVQRWFPTRLSSLQRKTFSHLDSGHRLFTVVVFPNQLIIFNSKTRWTWGFIYEPQTKYHHLTSKLLSCSQGNFLISQIWPECFFVNRTNPSKFAVCSLVTFNSNFTNQHQIISIKDSCGFKILFKTSFIFSEFLPTATSGDCLAPAPPSRQLRQTWQSPGVHWESVHCYWHWSHKRKTAMAEKAKNSQNGARPNSFTYLSLLICH